MTVIKVGSSSLYWRGIDPGRKYPQWVPLRAQRMYYEALKALEGKELPNVGPIEGGIGGCCYLLMQESPGLLPLLHWSPRSLVIAVQLDYCESPTGPTVRPPIEERRLGSATWWVASPYNLDVVRLLTEWVDGFMAFTPHDRTK